MKKSDIAMVIFIVGLVGMVTYFMTDMLLSTPTKSPQTVTYAEKFTDRVAKPDRAVFNEHGINPTVESNIGSTGGLPFKSTSEEDK